MQLFFILGNLMWAAALILLSLLRLVYRWPQKQGWKYSGDTNQEDEWFVSVTPEPVIKEPPPLPVFDLGKDDVVIVWGLSPTGIYRNKGDVK